MIFGFVGRKSSSALTLALSREEREMSGGGEPMADKEREKLDFRFHI